MKLLLINGSPKGKKSNTKVLTDAFLSGFQQIPENNYEEVFLNNKSFYDHFEKRLNESDALILAFPLYTDAMPGMVKELIEKLAPLKKVLIGKSIGFIVQSGFPESHHSIFVRRYLEKLCSKLEMKYIGTAIKGGVEGIQIKPEWMIKKTINQFTKLGFYFAHHKVFKKSYLNKLSKPVKFSQSAITFFKIGRKLNITNFYWNAQLKSNKAYENRFDKPYQVN
jgi:multimeric flavodoxin WrbA